MTILFDPTAPPKRRLEKLAPRTGSLEGKVIELLDIGKPKGDLLLETVGRLLKEHYGVAETV